MYVAVSLWIMKRQWFGGSSYLLMLLEALGDELVLSNLLSGPWPGQEVHKLSVVLVLNCGFP